MKTKNISISLFSILLIVICSKCGLVDYSYQIDVVNKSNHPIGYYFATGGEYGTYYPESLPKNNNYVVYDMSKVLEPGYESHLDWEKFFRTLPKDTLSIFIFHTDTLNKYTWSEVRNRYKILKRYDLSLDDLERMNFKVTYP